jgi:hypothetical protein
MRPCALPSRRGIVELSDLVLQTAHDPSFLARALLAGLPPVPERLRLMRSGKAPGVNAGVAQSQMDQSQVRLMRSGKAPGVDAGVAQSQLDRPICVWCTSPGTAGCGTRSGKGPAPAGYVLPCLE